MDTIQALEYSEQKAEIPFKRTPEGLGREKMMDEALILASYLSEIPCIERVGIGGSLSRGKEHPSDIDLVIFIDNKRAKACFIEKITNINLGIKKRLDLSKYLPMNDDDWNMFVGILSNIESAVDLILVSNDPDEVYSKIMARYNIDPNFLNNIGNNALIYNSETDSFTKQDVYTENQIQIINQASFDQIRKIVTHPNDHYFDSIYRSHSHQKRIPRNRLNKQNQ